MTPSKSAIAALCLASPFALAYSPPRGEEVRLKVDAATRETNAKARVIKWRDALRVAKDERDPGVAKIAMRAMHAAAAAGDLKACRAFASDARQSRGLCATSSAGDEPAPAAAPQMAPAGPADHFVLLPAGTFPMGSDHGYADEKPPHDVALAAFFLERNEVTAGEFQKYVLQSGAAPPATSSPLCNYAKPDRASHPINCVTWQQAHDYCAARYSGGRLPTEAEWEYAARGAAGREYPWGAESPAAQLCWKRWDPVTQTGKGTCEVGSFQVGRTPDGLQDMAGNVWEWTADLYSATGYQDAPAINPAVAPPSKTHRVARGGAWTSGEPSGVRAAIRNATDPSTVSPAVGFRCARAVDLPRP